MEEDEAEMEEDVEEKQGSRPALRVGLGFQVELLEIILDLHPNAANSLTTGSWGRPGWEIAGLILVQWQ